MEEFSGRVAVVTGASRSQGIGAAICRQLACQGAHVFFTHWLPADHESGYEVGEGPAGLLRELRALGPAGAMALDLSEPNAPERLLDAAQAELGLPSILVNNATHCAPTSFEDLADVELERHIAVNVRATMLLSSAFVRRCKVLGAGRIVSLVSGQDHSAERGNLAYGATKGAISAMTRYLALEAAPYGITVNAVDPGPTDTGWMDDALRASLLAAEPMGRLGQAEDAARAVSLLCSPAAAFITGEVLVADGGFSLA